VLGASSKGAPRAHLQRIWGNSRRKAFSILILHMRLQNLLQSRTCVFETRALLFLSCRSVSEVHVSEQCKCKHCRLKGLYESKQRDLLDVLGVHPP